MVENKDQVNIPEVDLSLMIIIFITQKIETLRVHATPGLSIWYAGGEATKALNHQMVDF